jgi:hypothetical protein
MIAGFKKSGHLKELPPAVNAENVAFFEQHEAELMKKLEAVQALGKQLEGENERAKPDEDTEETPEGEAPPRNP